jgi:hypothetical protein
MSHFRGDRRATREGMNVPIEVVFGTLIALTVAIVGGTWKLSSRLGAVEAMLSGMRAESAGRDHRIVALELGRHDISVIATRLAIIESRCADIQSQKKDH